MWFGIISRNWSSWHFQRKTQTWHLSLTYGVQGCFCLIVFIFLVLTHSGKECSSPKVCAPPFLGSSQSSFLEKAMAPHSSTLAWKIPWTEEPGRLQSVGSRRVRHDWVTSLSLFTFTHWRRKWQPTPVFLPGESQGWGSPVGCRLWGRTELDTTEVT